MTLYIRRHDTAQRFLDRAEEWLLVREAEHNLLLGLAHRLLSPSDAFGHPIYIATVEDSGKVVGCALRTPPFKLLITRMPADAAPLLVEDVAQVYEEIPAILGEEDSAHAVGRAWCAHRGGAPRIGRRQRIYQLDRVVPPGRRAQGRMRKATMPDLDLVAEWVNAFTVEAGLPSQPARALAHERITSGSISLWEIDGTPVSMAGVNGDTRNGARIGYVFTPAEQREKGYASACVAALSQGLLDAGKQFCFLYTDLSNPTSNSIYQRIGYAPVCDVVDCVIERESS
jgi:predicted GNAT family acetyltransferase